MKHHLPVYAGYGERLLAHLLDSVIVIVLTSALFAMHGKSSLIPLLTFAGALTYYTYFTASGWQATPGKRLLGMYVARTDHRALGLREALERFLAFTLPTLPLYSSLLSGELLAMLSFCLGVAWFAPILFTDERMGYHDQLCGTRVLIGRVGS